MSDPLTEYILKCRESYFADDLIKQKLINSGNKIEDIGLAFEKLKLSDDEHPLGINDEHTPHISSSKFNIIMTIVILIVLTLLAYFLYWI